MSPKKKNKKRGKKSSSETDAPPMTAGEIIRRAEKLYRKNPTQAVNMLKTVKDESVFENNSQKLQYYRLLSFSLAESGKLKEAEEAAQKGLSLDEDDKDFYFTLAFIYTTYKDYKTGEKYCHKFLELNEKDDDSTKDKYLSHNYLNQIYNFIGLAYKNREQSENAIEVFLKSIKLKPSQEHAYLNLADLYRQEGNYDKASEIVNRGLKNCLQVQELRMMQKNLKRQATISACMIVKNEEEFLPGCLESIRDWVDEIVIVDTGSTDRTVEIAKSYGAKVYFKEWDGSFSTARNYSLSKVTSDWILYIDADEEFVQEDVPMLKKLLEQNDCSLISINIDNIDKKTGEITSTLIFNRVFRADAGVYFEGIVHNQLKHNPDAKAVMTPIRIKHFGYNLTPEKMQEKTARTRALLEEQLEKDPDFAFAHFNLAQLLRSVSTEDEPKAPELVIHHAERTLELADPNSGVYLMAHHQIAMASFSQGNYDKSIEFCLKSLKLKPDYLDGILTLGHTYMAQANYEKAEEVFWRYLKAQEEYLKAEMKDSLILLHIRARHNAYYHLGMIRMTQGNFDDAEEYFLKALDDRAPFMDTYSALTHIYLGRNDLEKAEGFIKKELAWRPDSELGNLYTGRLLTLKGERNKAVGFFDKALNLTTNNIEVLQMAGSFMANEKQFDKAINAFKKMTAIAPHNSSGWNYLARACLDNSDLSGAINAFEAYLELEPCDARAVNDLGNCFYEQKEFKKAEESFARALDLDDNLAPAYRNLGLAKYELGLLKEAQVLLENYYAVMPEDYEVVTIIGNIYARSKQYSTAIPYYEKVLAANPGNPDILFYISECYYYLGHFDSAAIGYKQVLKQNPDYKPAKKRLTEVETSDFPA